MATYPANPWTWTDDLTPSPDYIYLYHSEGTWFPWTGSGRMNHFFLGDLHYAVEMSVMQRDYYGGIIFELKEGYEANADLYRNLIFRIALEQTYQGSVGIILEDPTGKQAQRSFVSGYYPIFSEIVLAVGSINSAYWTVDVGFDWTKIKRIMVSAFFKQYIDTGAIFVAYLHFESLETFYDLTVNVKTIDPKTGTAIPLPNATVTPGVLVGIDPATGKESWWMLETERQLTDTTGQVIFHLEPNIYMVQVKLEGFKEGNKYDINLTVGNLTVSVELNPISPVEEIMKIVFPVVVLIGTTIILSTLIQQI